MCDTRRYREFCVAAFGRFIDHLPNTAKPTEQQRRAIQAMRRRTADLAASGGITGLLTLDFDLGLPGAAAFAEPERPKASHCSGVSIIASTCSSDSSSGDGGDGGGCGGD